METQRLDGWQLLAPRRVVRWVAGEQLVLRKVLRGVECTLLHAAHSRLLLEDQANVLLLSRVLQF